MKKIFFLLPLCAFMMFSCESGVESNEEPLTRAAYDEPVNNEYIEIWQFSEYANEKLNLTYWPTIEVDANKTRIEFPFDLDLYLTFQVFNGYLPAGQQNYTEEVRFPVSAGLAQATYSTTGRIYVIGTNGEDKLMYEAKLVSKRLVKKSSADNNTYLVY